MPIYIPFLDWRFMQALGGHNHRRRWKYEKREAKLDGYDNSFGVGLLPYLGHVCLGKDLSAWAEQSCNLSVVLNPLDCQFQIFEAMRQELRKRNKLTWGVNILKFILHNPFYDLLDFTQHLALSRFFTWWNDSDVHTWLSGSFVVLPLWVASLFTEPDAQLLRCTSENPPSSDMVLLYPGV